MANRGAGGRKGKTMQPSEKNAKRPGNEKRTTANKARRTAKREALIQKRRDKYRDGMTVAQFKNRELTNV